MRILLATAPGAGHLFPTVPLVWALRSAGHEILLTTTGPGVTLGPAAGLATVDAARGVPGSYAAARSRPPPWSQGWSPVCVHVPGRSRVLV